MSTFSKNIKLFRLQKGYTRCHLARMAGLSAQSITHYETGRRMPRKELLERLASVLDIGITDLLRPRDNALVFVHEQWAGRRHPTRASRELVTESIEDYVGRVHAVTMLLGPGVLPDAPVCHALPPALAIEEAAARLRRHLRLPENGPIHALAIHLEDVGILVHGLDFRDGLASTHGLANGRPYIAINTAGSRWERRLALFSETAKLMFQEETAPPSKRAEEHQAAAMAGAFFLPAADLRRELGSRRTSLHGDARDLCRKYGIPYRLLVERAFRCGVISRAVREATLRGNGFTGEEGGELSPREEPSLLRRLVLRAVAEGLVTVGQATILTNIPESELLDLCR